MTEYSKGASNCKPCIVLRTAEYRKAHPEKRKEYNSKNAERLADYGRAHRLANLERTKNTHSAYYTAHVDEYRERARQRYWNNPEKYREASRNWYHQNRERARKKSKEWMSLNQEYRIAYMQKWRIDNAKHIKDYSVKYYYLNQSERRAYYQDNRKRHNMITMAWQKKNKAKAKSYRQKRRALKMMAGGTISSVQWKMMCEHYDNLCVCCTANAPLTMDHIIPLTKGGNHTIDNIQPLCLPCNARKGNRHAHDFRPYPLPF